MTKIVISNCYGGFGVSRVALHRLREMGNKHALKETDIGEEWPHSDLEKEHKARKDSYDSFLDDIPRDDPQFVAVVEELESKAGAPLANLVVIEIPDDVEWVLVEYDGNEWIAEKHRTWG